MNVRILIVFSYLCVLEIFAFPNSVSHHHSFIVKRSVEGVEDVSEAKETTTSDKTPKIYEMRVDSNITNRFAHTLVTSKVKNPGTKAKETVFSIILPKKAFISKFVMSIDGKDYEAYIQEKQKAQKTYNQAVSSGQGAGLVAANARESNSFTVTVNVEPENKVIFYLTYEELLERRDNQYELVVNIHPKQPVKDLTVYVNINESQPLSFVKAPSIRSGNEINKIEGDLDPRANIDFIDSSSATVKFSPNIERQKELAKVLGTNVDEGLSGQFIVQYDVERHLDGGEILLKDGYFVHFFAPPYKKTLPKYVLFVLDTSSSMYDTKIAQLKTAMKVILRDLNSEDKFHLIEFNSIAKVLNLHNLSATVQYPSHSPGFFRSDSKQSTEDINEKDFVRSCNVNSENIEKATKVVDGLFATGGTNIADALKVALYLVELEKKNNDNSGVQPMIIFLTDGDATVGVLNSADILSGVSEQNTYSTPIYSLSFGDGADRNLLKKLSLRNNAFSRHIYEASDASLQLQDFYKQISSPILSNVTFKYTDDATEMTKTNFPILFNGSELVVVGRLDKDFSKLPVITCIHTGVQTQLVPNVKQPITQLERLWAYLTIQQLFDNMERFHNKTAYEKKALDLALKYSFVTPVSSLVVVKPNATSSAIAPVPAEKSQKFPSLPLQTRMSPRYSSRVNSRHFISPLYTPVSYYYPPSHESALTMGILPGPPAAIGFSSRSMSFSRPRFDSVFDYDASSIQTHHFTTSLRPYLTTTISPLQKLKNNLSWLNDILKNDIISTLAGEYKLGLNETSTKHVECPLSPKNTTGFCKLLHECPKVHHLLTTVDSFLQYRCEMRGFAAICCPKKSNTV